MNRGAGFNRDIAPRWQQMMQSLGQRLGLLNPLARDGAEPVIVTRSDSGMLVWVAVLLGFFVLVWGV